MIPHYLANILLAWTLGDTNGDRRTATEAPRGADGTSDRLAERTPEYTYSGYKPGKRPRLSTAGVRAGEIIGWRLWLTSPRTEQLVSISANFEWPCREYPKSKSYFPGYPNMGYHAYKNEEQALDAASQYRYSSIFPIVLGQVAMWGEVIEHEKGWRSEYAYPKALEYVCSNYGMVPYAENIELEDEILLARLREKYGLAPA